MRFFDLMTPLSRREVLERLRHDVGTGWFSGDEPVMGRVSDRSFSLRKRIGYRNSFQTNLRGRYVEEKDGTRIKCYAGMHPFVIVFMTVWFALVLSSTAATVLAGAEVAARSAVFVWGLPIFAIVLIGVGRYIARNERAELVAFLEDVIDASPVA